MSPIYFVVQRVLGRSWPSLYHEELPREPIRYLEYVMRLDLLPNAERLLATPLKDLFSVYKVMKARGTLPPRWEPPPRPAAGKPTAKPGYREELPGVRIARHMRNVARG